MRGHPRHRSHLTSELLGQHADQDGTIRFARGPHRGAPAEDHVVYLQAMLDQPFEEEMIQAVRRILFELGQRFW